MSLTDRGVRGIGAGTELVAAKPQPEIRTATDARGRPRWDDRSMKSIVIATDGSESSVDAVRAGFELAQETGARATVVTVRSAISNVIGAPFSGEELSDQLAHARAALDAAEAEGAAREVDADYEILEGDAVEQILQIADRRDADLVVVGSRGRGAITGTLFGSVSRGVVTGADRPVLVVKGDGQRSGGRAVAEAAGAEA